jgi:CheY-like chemotaxis protein
MQCTPTDSTRRLNPLDQPLHACHTLVVDGQSISRSTLAGRLRDLGVGHVSTCNRPSEAQRQLGERSFDFVLCEQHFEGGELGGQELLDQLRRTRSLPFWTIFIIVTAEATHAKVSEAAESSLDGYLVKPATTTALGERIAQARRRKQALQDIFLAIEVGRLEQAALLCLKRFTDRAEYWLYAARVGAEVLLRLGKPQAARKFFEAIREVRRVPWGSLGIARAEADAGANQQARRTIENLIADNPAYADAYDLMGRIHVDQGDFSSALTTYRTPAHSRPAASAGCKSRAPWLFTWAISRRPRPCSIAPWHWTCTAACSICRPWHCSPASSSNATMCPGCCVCIVSVWRRQVDAVAECRNDACAP